jgi:uncharacterized spore protein YtfJ
MNSLSADRGRGGGGREDRSKSSSSDSGGGGGGGMTSAKVGPNEYLVVVEFTWREIDVGVVLGSGCLNFVFASNNGNDSFED